MPLTPSTVGKVVRRLLLYFGLAFAGLIVLALISALSVRTGIVIPIRWVALPGFTLLIFWSTVKLFRRDWKRPAFWSAIVALLVSHLLAFVVILVRYPRWPLVWFVPVSILETGVFVAILTKLFDDETRSHV